MLQIDCRVTALLKGAKSQPIWNSDPEKISVDFGRKYGGEYLVRGGNFVIVEGDWKPSRVVLRRFLDMASAQAMYNDPEYQPLKALRQRECKTDAVFAEGWSISTVAIIQTGMPWHVSDSSNDFAGTGEQQGNSTSNQSSQWDFFGNPSDFTPVHGFTDVIPTAGGYTLCNPPAVQTECVNDGPGIPFFPGSPDLSEPPTANSTCNQRAAGLGRLAIASLRLRGCYGLGSSVLIPPPYGGYGITQWNEFYDGGFRNWDLSVTKVFKITEHLSAQFRADFFNVLNHPNFANPFNGPGGAIGALNPSNASFVGLGVSGSTPDVGNADPVLGSGGARNVQLGLKLSF